MKNWPAIDVLDVTEPDLVLAEIDEFGPTAVEERGTGLRLFFATAAARDAACAALRSSRRDSHPLDVPDEDWARRSQESLGPVTVGRITIAPPWAALSPQPSALIVINPSMGFGTGHHPTTRLCLAALQAMDLTGRDVLDIGTGSGVLALAAVRLGASRAIGIDSDADAIQSAAENLALNPAAPGTGAASFEVGDLASFALGEADVAVANLTGGLLVRVSATLARATRAGGVLIVSGLLEHERADVCRAFEGLRVVEQREEAGWLSLTMKKPGGTARVNLEPVFPV